MVWNRLITTGFFIALAAFVAEAGPLAAPRPDAPDDTGMGWTLVRLDLVVTLIPEEQRLEAEATARLRLDREWSSGPALAMNSRDTIMRFLRVEGPAVVEVGLNEPHPELEAPRMARIVLDRPRYEGEQVELSVAWESTTRGSQFLVAPELAVASWTEAWYPVPIAPLKSFSLSKLASAPGTTTLHLPPGWRSVSEGRLVESRTTRTGALETWDLSVPMARSFAAGPYEVARHAVGEREVGVYLLSAKPASARQQAEALASAIAVMESRFGPFPFPSYGIAEVPEGLFTWYAASQQGFILARSGAFEFEHGNLPLFAHEAAHAWWGNLVGTDGPGGILCSESLAQYGAVIAIEQLEGEEAATRFLRFSRAGYSPQQCARGYFELRDQGQDKPLSQLEPGGWQHTLADAKGHWVYHMLRRRVGDDVFFGTLRAVIEEYAGRKLSLDAMRSAFLATAPRDAELERFFAQWLDRSGAPVLELAWSDASKKRRHLVELTIRQTQEAKPYDLDLEVEVASADGASVHRVRLRERETTVLLKLSGAPREVRLDPANRLLIWKPDYATIDAE